MRDGLRDDDGIGHELMYLFAPFSDKNVWFKSILKNGRTNYVDEEIYAEKTT